MLRPQRSAGGQKVEDILDANAEPADARTTAAHVGIHGDSGNGAHVSVPLPPASEPDCILTNRIDD